MPGIAFTQRFFNAVHLNYELTSIYYSSIDEHMNSILQTSLVHFIRLSVEIFLHRCSLIIAIVIIVFIFSLS